MRTEVKNLWHEPKARTLVLAGLVFVFAGVSQIGTAGELKPSMPSYQAYAAQFSLFSSLVVWGSFFVISGTVAMVAALKKKYYYIGFGSLMLMSMWWALLFVASLVMTGWARIIPNIFTWALVSIFLYTISAWQEAPTYED